MDILVGYTGFVGGVLEKQHRFDLLCNRANITEAYGTKPRLLVYSGVPSEMFTANSDPERDRKTTLQAWEHIRRIDADCTVLISTVAVYDETRAVDEDHPIDESRLSAYGANRLELERHVESLEKPSLIVRLPAIYGEGLKKNFIYDLIHYAPALLRPQKLHELAQREPMILDHYADRGDGFYFRTCAAPSEELKQAFRRVGFSALNFTDSRSVYQFFSLRYLWAAIEGCLKRGIRKINLVTPPLSAGQVYTALTSQPFENPCAAQPFSYDIRTKYTPDGYILSKEQTLLDIADFVRQQGGSL